MLETKDLILKKGVIDDWKPLYENFWRQEETARYMLWSAKKTEEEGLEMTKGAIEFQQVNPTAYFVYEKKSGQPIGIAGMKEMEPGVFEDSGIGVGPAFVGKGYGKQILSALIEQAFVEYQADKFIYSCFQKNVASAKLALSQGFHYVRSESCVDRRNGQPYKMDYYELVARENNLA